MNFVVQLVVALALMLVSFLLTPKPKQTSNTDTNSMDDPKASAGTPVKVVFGTITIKDPNILWYGDKSTHTFKVKV